MYRGLVCDRVTERADLVSGKEYRGIPGGLAKLGTTQCVVALVGMQFHRIVIHETEAPPRPHQIEEHVDIFSG